MGQSAKVALEILGGLIIGCSVVGFFCEWGAKDRDSAKLEMQQKLELCPDLDCRPHLLWECRYTGEYDGICVVSNPTLRVGTGCARVILQNQGGLEVAHIEHLCLADSLKPNASTRVAWDADVRVTHHGFMPNALCGDPSGEIPPCKVVGMPSTESWGRWVFPWQK